MRDGEPSSMTGKAKTVWRLIQMSMVGEDGRAKLLMEIVDEDL